MLKSFSILCFLLVATVAQAADWDVAVVFLGRQEPADFQADIDRNLLELAKLSPNARFRLSLLRQFPDRVTSAFFDGTSRSGSRWDALFANAPLAGVVVPGVISSMAAGRTVMDEPALLGGFFRRAFARPNARRLLVIYGHGEGFRGLTEKPLLELQKNLESTIPSRVGAKALDLLWFDSCFMASLEVLTQLRNLSHFFLAAEDAEFSAGVPFDSFAELEDGPDDPRAMALFFAGRFLESYSFIEKGSQTGAVSTSSATIAVVESARLERVLPLFRPFVATLKTSDVARLLRAQPKMTMERPLLLDFGRLLWMIARDGRNTILTKAAQPLATAFEIGRTMQAQRSPRLLLSAPVPNSRVMFGFGDWTRGFEADPSLNWTAPLQPTGYQAGPSQRRWPVRTINKRIYVQPFQPGVDVFNAVFLDANDKILGAPIRARRFRDIHFFSATRAENPVLFAGHTVGLGAQSDRYTGLNVADPTMGLPGLDYIETDFFKLTGWGQ